MYIYASPSLSLSLSLSVYKLKEIKISPFYHYYVLYTNKKHNYQTFHLMIASNILYYDRPIGLMSRVFANDPGDWDSISGRVIPKTQKIVLDASLLNTQHYKVRLKDKVQQSKEWRSALPYT